MRGPAQVRLRGLVWLAGEPTLIGRIRAGLFPREMALTPACRPPSISPHTGHSA
jgi:hypothetical protein